MSDRPARPASLLTAPRGGRRNGLDVVKWCMALCVIAIHTEPLIALRGTALYAVYDSVVHCAVPFFFLASGYLLASKLRLPYTAPENLPALRGFCRKMLRMYLTWSAVYFPLAAVHAYRQGQSAAQFAFDYVRKLIFGGAHHNSWQLWYLLSSCCVVLLMLLFIRLRLPFGAAVAVGCTLSLLGLAIGFLRAREALPSVLASFLRLLDALRFNELLFRGFFYLPLGMLFARRLIRLPYAAALFVLGLFVHSVTEGFAEDLACVAASAGLFCIAEAMQLRDRPLYPVLRRMSTVMYLAHMLVFTALYWAVYREKTFGPAMFFGTAAGCMLLSLTWNLLRRRRSPMTPKT